jgi:hypothetical protein
MYKCEVNIELPLVYEFDTDLARYYKVAEYSNDPGWQIGDVVPFKNVKLVITTTVAGEVFEGKDITFNFTGIVIKRETIAEPEQLTLWICVETDKERIEDMIKTIQENNPSQRFKDTRKLNYDSDV